MFPTTPRPCVAILGKEIGYVALYKKMLLDFVVINLKRLRAPALMDEDVNPFTSPAALCGYRIDISNPL